MCPELVPISLSQISQAKKGSHFQTGNNQEIISIAAPGLPWPSFVGIKPQLQRTE